MNNFMRFPATALLLGSTMVFASGPDSGAVGESEPVVVTATRTAQMAGETLAAVTTVTRQDIERLQARSLRDLLRGMPGVDVANRGGMGKRTSLFLRGTNPEQVLVFIDGVRTGSVTSGTTGFESIPVDQIERIEIVRGPRSSLYGSGAVGGVIQIFTRRGGGANKASFSAGAGSFNTFKTYAGISGGGESGWFSANVNTIDTRGFNACYGKPNPGGAGCKVIEPDKDGYANRAISLRGGYRFANRVEMDAHLLHTSNDTDNDGGNTNETEGMQQVVGVRFRYSPAENLQLTLGGGQSQDNADYFKNGSAVRYIDTKRDTVSLQYDLTIAANHLITQGIDYYGEGVDSSIGFTTASRDNSGLFLQYQGKFGANRVHFSLREDNNEQFGKYTTGGLAWGYPLSDRLRLTAAWGSAFRAPAFNELYYPGFSNPDLEPEESRSYELGLAGEGEWGRWTLHAYETRAEALITRLGNTLNNIGEARIRGMEAEVAIGIGGWMIATNVTLLDPENRSEGSRYGDVLPWRAEQSLRIDADRSLGRYTIGGTLLAEGRRYDYDDAANTNTLKLDSYAVLDLRLSYRFNKLWLLQARIENLFDEAYETEAYYNQPGRGLYLTLHYRP